MIRALHELPDAMILVLIVATLTFATYMAPVVGRRYLGNKEKGDAEVELFDAFTGVMAILGVMLAFSLVEATTNQRALQQKIGEEASQISDLDLILLRSGGAQCDNVRPQLTAYAKSRLADEWPALTRGERSAKTDHLYDQVSTAIRFFDLNQHQSAQTYDQTVKLIDGISSAREYTIDNADQSLPDFFWVTVAGLLVIGLVLAGMNDCTLRRRLALAGTMAAVAMLLAYVLILDMPLAGSTPEPPQPIQKAITVMQGRMAKM